MKLELTVVMMLMVVMVAVVMKVMKVMMEMGECSSSFVVPAVLMMVQVDGLNQAGGQGEGVKSRSRPPLIRSAMLWS